MGTIERCKVVVIGTGAGGAPAAARLAETWGEGVVLLEAGPHMHASDFTQVEREMMPRLYAGSRYASHRRRQHRSPAGQLRGRHDGGQRRAVSASAA